MPVVSEETLRTLPEPRPTPLNVAGGLVLLTVGVVAIGLVHRGSPEHHETGANAYALALNLAPWALTFPWLRHLDIRRVPWFFLCIISPLLGPVLLAFVGYRVLALPRRTWPVAYWNGHRARRIPATRTWVLLPEDAVAEPEVSARVARWEGVERVAWVLMMVVAGVFKVWPEYFETAIGGFWLASLLALAVAPPLVDWMLRIRARRDELAEDDPGDTSNPL